MAFTSIGVIGSQNPGQQPANPSQTNQQPTGQPQGQPGQQPNPAQLQAQQPANNAADAAKEVMIKVNGKEAKLSDYKDALFVLNSEEDSVEYEKVTEKTCPTGFKLFTEHSAGQSPTKMLVCQPTAEKVNGTTGGKDEGKDKQQVVIVPADGDGNKGGKPDATPAKKDDLVFGVIPRTYLMVAIVVFAIIFVILIVWLFLVDDAEPAPSVSAPVASVPEIKTEEAV